LRLLVDHRERLVRHRVELNSTLLWHLHDLWPELQLRVALVLEEVGTQDRSAPGRAEQSMRVRIARDELRRMRELTQAINQLEREITELVGRLAPQLVNEPGFGPLIAAKLVGEIAGAERFATAAKLARAAGVAPIPAAREIPNANASTSGGSRQINAALHRVIVTRAAATSHPRLHRTATQRRQEHTRSHPLPQALPRPPRLATAATSPPRAGEAHPINFLT
jgi:transposase